MGCKRMRPSIDSSLESGRVHNVWRCEKRRRSCDCGRGRPHAVDAKDEDKDKDKDNPSGHLALQALGTNAAMVSQSN